MKKHLIIIFFINIYLSNIYSQNLVQNSDFEDHNSGSYGENPFYDGEIAD